MASGSWLDSPVAVLKATDDDDKPASVLLSLAEPRYDNASRTLTFKVCSFNCKYKAVIVKMPNS